jgi:hypothetical protein
MTDELDQLTAQGTATGLQDAIPNRMAVQTANYDVEYGVRSDDDALVFHFYPPGTDWSTNPPGLGKWNDSYKMHDRLEAAIPQIFSVEHIKARYTEELQSFCIIAYDVGKSPDPYYFVRSFLQKIDSL